MNKELCQCGHPRSEHAYETEMDVDPKTGEPKERIKREYCTREDCDCTSFWPRSGI